MRRSFHLRSFFSAFAIFLFSALASPCARGQSAAPTASVGPSDQTLAQKITVPGVPNAGKITDVLYRGAQPKQLDELRKLGVTTIVDLRGEDHDKVGWERKQTESLGMRFVHIPVSGWSPPTNEQIVEFLSLFRGDPKQRVFLHCRFGDDRTGVFVATYRMTFGKWPSERALKEMYFFGFNGFWHPAMKTFIRNFPANLQSDPAFAFLRNPSEPK